ncbi:hypothetical protein HTV45_23470 [Streptomyces sp. CHD11]|uniref:hypothetical protein n=1 Tax=Streptomyces sp. CHD11 TaxID=2741325 RepID=UPI001BFCAC5E|nr:hypothetical protein [Streptomyces sp. CHD11]MBT3153792.1 hypothetical protein [Streptomyces sp. CHD11]
MVALRHTVLLAPVPLPWLGDSLAVLLDLAEDTRTEAGRVLLPDGREVPDVRHAGGRHLRPGAVYESTAEGEAGRITVEQWNRRRALELALAGSEPDGAFTVRGTLHRPDRPRLLEIDGRARVENLWSPLSRVSGGARLRSDDWWAAAGTGRTARTAPLRARLECGVARADLRAVPEPGGPDGHWQVMVTVRLRGRYLLRPVAAVVLRLGRRRLRRSLATALDEFAARWNDVVPGLVAMGPDAVRQEILAADLT